jgi:hypothetical protein
MKAEQIEPYDEPLIRLEMYFFHCRVPAIAFHIELAVLWHICCTVCR